MYWTQLLVVHCSRTKCEISLWYITYQQVFCIIQYTCKYFPVAQWPNFLKKIGTPCHKFCSEQQSYTFATAVSFSLPGLAWFCGLPYNSTADITSAAPNKNCPLTWKSNRYTDTTQETIIANDVAKPLRMLSAYFTTTATRSPPNACIKITIQTKVEYPNIMPFSSILSPSLTRIPIRPITVP